jgi:hypothetical protein
MYPPLKKILKFILPAGAWRLLRLHHLKRRQHLAPKIGQHADPEATRKAIGVLDAEWKARIRDVLSCPDNKFIPRCPEAGMLTDGFLTMHNGIRVGGLSYYGAGIMNLLMQNKGVHEPQEERAFQDVLPYIAPGSYMLELGAYWGFYSLWFNCSVPDAKNYLLEPMDDNLEAGVLNFNLNNRSAVFERAFIGARDDPSTSPKTVSVDSFMKLHQIDHLTILHSDVQGAELDMLHGAGNAVRGGKIDYFFISTHSKQLHVACLEFLSIHGYRILASATPEESHADDGVIVAIRNGIPGPAELHIHKKQIPT